jgi:hypothetical protein
MTIARFHNLDVLVESESRALPDKPALDLANRIDVRLTVHNADGSVLVVADRFGYTDKFGHHPALAVPLTNLQRFFMTQHGR